MLPQAVLSFVLLCKFLVELMSDAHLKLGVIWGFERRDAPLTDMFFFILNRRSREAEVRASLF